MKTLITLLFLLIGFNSFSQSDNFKFINGDIIWQKIYNTKDLPDLNLLTDIEIKNNSGDIINGALIPKELDYKKYGYVTGNVHSGFITGVISGVVLFERKDNRTRVTINNIRIENRAGNVMLGTPNSTTNIELYLMNKRKGQLKFGQYITNTLDVMDKEFLSKLKTNTSDDW